MDLTILLYNCPGIKEAAQDYLGDGSQAVQDYLGAGSQAAQDSAAAAGGEGGGAVLTWLAGVLSDEAADRQDTFHLGGPFSLQHVLAFVSVDF